MALEEKKSKSKLLIICTIHTQAKYLLHDEINLYNVFGKQIKHMRMCLQGQSKFTA